MKTSFKRRKTAKTVDHPNADAAPPAPEPESMSAGKQDEPNSTEEVHGQGSSSQDGDQDQASTSTSTCRNEDEQPSVSGRPHPLLNELVIDYNDAHKILINCPHHYFNNFKHSFLVSYL